MSIEGSKTIKVFGDYSVELDGRGVVLTIRGRRVEFYPETADEARDMASSASTIKRRMLQRAHALSVKEEERTDV